MTLKYDHPNWTESVKALAERKAASERTENEDRLYIDAVADIFSSLICERPALDRNEEEVNSWCQWIENGQWSGDETLEGILEQVDELL